MTEQRPFQPKWASPPGATILDLLAERGWNQAELARRTGFSEKHISLLTRGRAALTDDTAIRLERTLGSTARFWLAREAQYREALARVADAQQLADEGGAWLRELPYAEMVRRRWIEPGVNLAEKVAACLRYFGVANVAAWRTTYEAPLAVFRASTKAAKATGSVAAWLRRGELVAADIPTADYDPGALEASLPALRALTARREQPAEFLPELTARCAGVGVAVVVEPALKGCPAYGATRWLKSSRALLMLSLRYRSDDQFWFSFFHEVAHLLRHPNQLTLELDNGGQAAMEAEANQLASDILVPKQEAARLARVKKSAAAVSALAERLGVSPGVVVGRLQHEGRLPRSHLNKLKVFYS